MRPYIQTRIVVTKGEFETVRYRHMFILFESLIDEVLSLAFCKKFH